MPAAAGRPSGVRTGETQAGPVQEAEQAMKVTGATRVLEATRSTQGNPSVSRLVVIVLVLVVPYLRPLLAGESPQTPQSGSSRQGHTMRSTGRAAELIAAVRAHDLRRVELELLRGTHPDSRDPNGLTPLMWAEPRTALVLLDGGADPHLQDHFERTALSYAAYAGDAALVRLLLSRGVRSNVQDEDGWTPLRFTLFGAKLIGDIYSREPALNVLLSHRSSIREGAEPIAVLKALLAAGADPNARDRIGDPTFFEAVIDSSPHVMLQLPLLVTAGANLNARNADGNTVLMLAPRLALTQELLARGAKVNTQNEQGWTALTFAASHNSLDQMRLLLEHGAEVDPPAPRYPRHRPWTPLMAAAVHGHVAAMELLLERGADPSVKRGEETAHSLARQHRAALRLLNAALRKRNK